MTALLAIRAFLKANPWQAWAALAAVAALAIIWNVAGNAGEARKQREWDAATRAAIEQARNADEAAQEAVENTRNNVEQSNHDARNAAENSPSDPLGAGLRSLRRDTAHSGASTCNSSRVRRASACA